MDDGTTVRIKITVISVNRAVDQYDPAGLPMYQFNVLPVFGPMDVPERLRKNKKMVRDDKTTIQVWTNQINDTALQRYFPAPYDISFQINNFAEIEALLIDMNQMLDRMIAEQMIVNPNVLDADTSAVVLPHDVQDWMDFDAFTLDGKELAARLLQLSETYRAIHSIIKSSEWVNARCRLFFLIFSMN